MLEFWPSGLLVIRAHGACGLDPIGRGTRPRRGRRAAACSGACPGLSPPRLEHLAALAAHSVSEADVAALAEAQKELDQVKTQPRQSIVGRSVETAALPERVSAMKKFLRDRLDRQVRRFRRTPPEFFAAYRSARVVLGPIGRGSDEASDAGGAPATPAAPVA